MPKRLKLFQWLKHKNNDIILLQETHCTHARLQQFKNSWDGDSWYGLSDSPHSKGVGILIKKDSHINVVNDFQTDDGRTILLNVNCDGNLFTFVNIYAPNDIAGRSKYFTKLLTWIPMFAHTKDNLILAGDFNCCKNYTDRSTNTHIDDRSRTMFNTLIDKLHLRDVWCDTSVVQYGDMYTWNDQTTKSRLDYFIIGKNSCLHCDNISTLIVITDQRGKRITDHKALLLKTYINTPKRGPGYWKLNTTLLQNPLYCQDIKGIINSTISDEHLINVNLSVKWDILKKRIKQYTIITSINKTRTIKSELQILEEQVRVIDDTKELDVNTIEKNSYCKIEYMTFTLKWQKELSFEHKLMKLRKLSIILNFSKI